MLLIRLYYSEVYKIKKKDGKSIIIKKEKAYGVLLNMLVITNFIDYYFLYSFLSLLYCNNMILTINLSENYWG